MTAFAGIARPHLRASAGLIAGLAAFPVLACEPVLSVHAELGHGVYCLTKDVVAADINVLFTLDDDATLDCQGHAIRDGGLPGQAIYSSGADNIEIRNCVFEGFGRAINLWQTTHYRVVDNVFLAPMGRAIDASGSDGWVSGNRFSYPVTPRPGYPEYWYQQWIAIMVSGTADIMRNTISAAVSPDGSGWVDRFGIWSSENDGGLVAFNVVRGLVHGQQDRARIGLIVQGNRGVAYRNLVALPAVAWSHTFDVGIQCLFNGTVSVQNISVGAWEPYSNCNAVAEMGLGALPRHR